MGSMGPRPPIRASWWNQAALQPSHARPPNQPRPSTSKPSLVGLVAWQDSMTSLEATLTIQALPPAIPCTSTEPGPQLGPGSIQLSRRCCWKGRRIAVACASREQETCLKTRRTPCCNSMRPRQRWCSSQGISPKLLSSREATRIFSDSLSHTHILQNSGHLRQCGIRHSNAPHPASAAHTLPVCPRRVRATPGTKLR